MKRQAYTILIVGLIALAVWLLGLMPAQAQLVGPSSGGTTGAGNVQLSQLQGFGNSGNLLLDNGAAWISTAISGDFCETSFATFVLCAVQGIPISGTLSTTVAGQVLTTDGNNHIVPSTTYVSVNALFSTPTSSLALPGIIPALNFNANFGAANNVPAASASCVGSAPSSGRDFAVNCMITGSLTKIGDITVSTSCTTTGDTGITLTTVGGTAKSCAAGTIDIVAPATVDGSGIVISVNGHS